QCVVHPRIADVVYAALEFPGGRLAHVHVSWLDPHKTRKLTVIGARKCAVFDDTGEHKLVIHDKGFQRRPHAAGGPDLITLYQGPGSTPEVDAAEPLTLEAQHFVDCIRQQKRPISDGESGTMVVSVLEHGQRSLELGGEAVTLP